MIVRDTSVCKSQTVVSRDSCVVHLITWQDLLQYPQSRQATAVAYLQRGRRPSQRTLLLAQNSQLSHVSRTGWPTSCCFCFFCLLSGIVCLLAIRSTAATPSKLDLMNQVPVPGMAWCLQQHQQSVGVVENAGADRHPRWCVGALEFSDGLSLIRHVFSATGRSAKETHTREENTSLAWRVSRGGWRSFCSLLQGGGVGLSPARPSTISLKMFPLSGFICRPQVGFLSGKHTRVCHIKYSCTGNGCDVVCGGVLDTLIQCY